MKMEHVEGEKKGDVLLFALSTCIWCKKTRMFLEEIGIDFKYIYVDLLSGNEKSEVINEIKKWNPQISFPTVVVNSKDVIVGFKKDELKEKLQ